MKVFQLMKASQILPCLPLPHISSCASHYPYELGRTSGTQGRQTYMYPHAKPTCHMGMTFPWTMREA